MAIAAAHNRGLQHVTPEDLTDVIGLLLDRRWQLVAQRQQLICQLHATLAELTPAGAKRHLTCDKAAVMLRRVRPGSAVDAQRKQVAQEMLNRPGFDGDSVYWFPTSTRVVLGAW